MRQLMELYGRLIAYAVVFIALGTILNTVPIYGHTGVIDALGHIMVVDEEHEENGADTLATKKLVSVAKPTVKYSPDGLDRILWHYTYNFKHYFTITDSQTGKTFRGDDSENVFDLQITAIHTSNGYDVTSSYNSKTGTVKFDSFGLFTVDVTVYDSQNQFERYRFVIPVDSK